MVDEDCEEGSVRWGPGGLWRWCSWWPEVILERMKLNFSPRGARSVWYLPLAGHSVKYPSWGCDNQLCDLSKPWWSRTGSQWRDSLLQFQQSSAFSFSWCQCFKLASTGRADNGILMISTCSQTTHPTAEVALPNPRRTVWTTKTTRSSEFPASPLLSFGLCFSSVLCCENCLAHTRKARQASNCSNNNSNTSTTTQGREPSQAYCSLSAIQFFSSISLVFLPAA